MRSPGAAKPQPFVPSWVASTVTRQTAPRSRSFVAGVDGVSPGMTYIDGDYYRLTVILAARITSQAGPEQVLVGEAAAGNGTPQGVRFEAVGPVPLKGVARPVTVYQAVRDEFSAAPQS
jgi:class 3 adenylate cyclase